MSIDVLSNVDHIVVRNKKKLLLNRFHILLRIGIDTVLFVRISFTLLACNVLLVCETLQLVSSIACQTGEFRGVFIPLI